MTFQGISKDLESKGYTFYEEAPVRDYGNFATDRHAQDVFYTNLQNNIVKGYCIQNNAPEEFFSTYLMKPLFADGITQQVPVKSASAIKNGLNPYAPVVYKRDAKGNRLFKTVDVKPCFQAKALKTMSQERGVLASFGNLVKKTILKIDIYSTLAGNGTLTLCQGTIGKIPLVGQPLSAALAMTIRVLSFVVLSVLALIVEGLAAVGLLLAVITGPGAVKLIAQPQIDELKEEKAALQAQATKQSKKIKNLIQTGNGMLNIINSQSKKINRQAAQNKKLAAQMKNMQRTIAKLSKSAKQVVVQSAPAAAPTQKPSKVTSLMASIFG